MTSTSYLMLVFFILLFSLSIWKLKAFFSTTELRDDDRNEASILILHDYIYEALDIDLLGRDDMSMEELYASIIKLKTFDKEHFWRLTPHRVRQVVEEYYVHNEGVDSLAEMLKQRKGDQTKDNEAL